MNRQLMPSKLEQARRNLEQIDIESAERLNGGSFNRYRLYNAKALRNWLYYLLVERARKAGQGTA